jgi:hypothetical protein
VDGGDAAAKFWLEPVSLARSQGFSARELSDLKKLIEGHENDFTIRWYEFFRSRRR